MAIDNSIFKQYGDDVLISPHSEIKRPQLVSLGNHIGIDFGFYMTTGGQFGDYIHISSHVSVIGGIKAFLKMGNFTNISTGGRIICGSDEFFGEGLISAPAIPEIYLDRQKIEPVIFEDFVNTGANVIVLPGITLAEGSVIAANSLVTRNTEPWTMYKGIPAKPFKLRKKEKMLEFASKLGYKK